MFSAVVAHLAALSGCVLHSLVRSQPPRQSLCLLLATSSRLNALQHRLPAGSGGDGEFRGGDGVVRELEFLRPLTASILSERRAVSPFGILGGLPAARGSNLWIKRDGRVVSLGGKATVQVGND